MFYDNVFRQQLIYLILHYDLILSITMYDDVTRLEHNVNCDIIALYKFIYYYYYNW